MSRVAYVDGQYLPHRSAAVHIEDRGYQFADGVYEVTSVLGCIRLKTASLWPPFLVHAVSNLIATAELAWVNQ